MKYLKVLVVCLLVFSFTGCDNVRFNIKFGEEEFNYSLNGDQIIDGFSKAWPIEQFFGYKFTREQDSFYPISYENGVVKGVISTFDIYSVNKNPIIYKEYECKDDVFKENGNLIDFDALIPVKVQVVDNKLVINDKEANAVYDIKLQDNIDVQYNTIKDQNQIKEEFNSFELFSGDESKGTVYINVAKISDRYIAISFNVSSADATKEFQLIFDYENKEIYKTNTYNLENSNMPWSDEVSGKFIECGTKIYRIDYLDGKLYEVLLKDNVMTLNEVFDFMFNKYDGSEYLTFLGTSNNKVFVSQNYNESTAISTPSSVYTIDSKDNNIEKSEMNGKNKVYIERVFEGSDDLVLINEQTTSNRIERWVAKYKDGNIEKIKKIESIKAGSGSVSYSVEEILYDNATNSFFLKRRITGVEGKPYQYEYLYIS